MLSHVIGHVGGSPPFSLMLMPTRFVGFSSRGFHARFLTCTRLPASTGDDNVLSKGADSLQQAVFTVAASAFAMIAVIVLSANRRVWEWDNIFKEKVVALKSAQQEVMPRRASLDPCPRQIALF
jgi:hypothetical protein